MKKTEKRGYFFPRESPHEVPKAEEDEKKQGGFAEGGRRCKRLRIKVMGKQNTHWAGYETWCDLNVVDVIEGSPAGDVTIRERFQGRRGNPQRLTQITKGVESLSEPAGF